MKVQSLLLIAIVALAARPAISADATSETTSTTLAGAFASEAAAPSPRAEIAAALMKFYGTGPTEAEIVDPAVEVVEEVDMGDHIRRTLAYNVEAGERVKGHLLLPKPLPTAEAKLPLVLCPHPTNRWGKDAVIDNYPTPPADEEDAAHRRRRTYALDLVRRGFICFAPDRAGYGERAPLPNEASAGKQAAAYRKELEQRRPGWGFTTGKAVWDLQRALDFLVELDFVDTERVACIGHSLGAWDTMLLTPVDDRVKVAVANAGGTVYFDESLWADAGARARHLADPRGGLNQNANLMLMGIAPRPFLYLRAINDSYEKGQPTLLEGYRLMIDYYRQAAGNKPFTWHAPLGIYFHANEHGFDREAQALAYTFLEVQLEGLKEEARN